MTLPIEIFGQKDNKQLVTQAVRVFLNQRVGGASTKPGTSGRIYAKIYNQKGTGRARHGSIRAHIFVGGGVAFGPVTHDFSLSMPTKMKRKALHCALSSQFQAGNIVLVDGLEALKLKTKHMAKALSAVSGAASSLLVLSKNSEAVAQIARNIEGVDIIPATSLNTYEVLSHKKIVFMKDAVGMIV